MATEFDLVAEIFSKMSTWGLPPEDGFEEKMIAQFPDISAQKVQHAVVVAAELQKLVLGSLSFYHDPYGTIHETVRTYLRENLPGLSEQAYFSAERRIMFLYIM